MLKYLTENHLNIFCWLRLEPVALGRQQDLSRTYNVVEALSSDCLVHLLVTIELVSHSSEQASSILSHLLDQIPADTKTQVSRE